MPYLWNTKLAELCLFVVLSLFLVFFSSATAAATAGTTHITYSGDYAVPVGKPFRITCQLSEFESVKWQRDGQSIDTDDHYRIDIERNNGTVLSHLSVDYAQPVHSGSYKCFTFDTTSYQLYVIGGITIKPNYDPDGMYKVLKPKVQELLLECTVTGASVNYTVTWLRNKTALPKDERFKTVQPNKLEIKDPVDKDADTYTCLFTFSNNATPSRQEDIAVIVPVHVRLPASTSAVEGEKLQLKCSVYGQPVPSIEWQIGNGTIKEDKGRIHLLEYDGVPNAMLQVDDTKMEDRGEYTCIARNGYWNETSATTMVRVKDKLAALWPFLGICAEVFVLCAIILIYEKKRNKTELEESDTDQSPEQKNTPDHGKDSVRQRK